MNHHDLKSELGTARGPRLLRHARVPTACLEGHWPEVRDGLAEVSLLIESGKILRLFRDFAPDIAPYELPEGTHTFDLAQRIVWPGCIDAHCHLDKGQVWARSPNPDGTFQSALTAAALDRHSYPCEDDMRQRAEFSLQAAYAHGTVALRSHVDAPEDGFDRRFAVLRELAQDWRGRIDVDLAPFCGLGDREGWVDQVAQTAGSSPSRALSLFLYQDPSLAEFLDKALRIASRYGLDLDVHADETLDVNSHCLRAVAEAVLRHRFDGCVLVGHCCALSVQPEPEAARTMDLVAQAGIGIVALPMCNAYLMDRGAGRSPRARGVAPLKELAARGIAVSISSDNSRDAFHAYGDMDVPELFRDSMRMMQLDHPVADWPATVTRTAAQQISSHASGVIKKAAPADLIVFAARNWSEFAARPQHNRIVLRDGVAISQIPPDFVELDQLEGNAP